MTSQKCILSCTAIFVPMFPYRSGVEELAELAGLEEAARHPVSPSPSQGEGKDLILQRPRLSSLVLYMISNNLNHMCRAVGTKNPTNLPSSSPR